MLSSIKGEMKPKLTSELAEILGMLVADGCIQKNYICLWGNITEDKPYYDGTVATLFKKVFKIKIRTHEKISNSVYGFYLCNKEIINFLSENFNLKPGSKTYTVKVPEAIMASNDTKIITAFIRGFADCDGYLNFDKRYGNYNKFNKRFNVYPRIVLISVSKELIEQLQYSLERIGIKGNIRSLLPRKDSEKTAYHLTIKGKTMLKMWMNLMGFNNPVHVTKYHIWKKFGLCPTRVNLFEREKILKGQINPYSYYKHGPVA